MRKVANFLFGEARILQRTAYTELIGGANARSEIAKIIGVGAVCHGSIAMLLCVCIELGIQLGLAEKASLMRVVGVAGISELHRADHHVNRADFGRHRSGFFHLFRGIGFRETGCGNCPISEADKTVLKHGVTIVGETNLAALVAADASALYARNVLDFLKLIVTKEGALKIDLEDDIVAACRMTQDGQVTRK